MTMFKTLKDLQNSTKKPAYVDSGDRVKRFFTIKPDESFQIRFRQELTEDSGQFDEANGVAHVVRVHRGSSHGRLCRPSHRLVLCEADEPLLRHASDLPGLAPVGDCFSVVCFDQRG